MENFFTYVYFFYGLAFFCMGMVVFLETPRSTEERLRFALPALAIFGFVHGIHEWYEMFDIMGMLPYQDSLEVLWEIFRIFLLVTSFLALMIFGVWMLARTREQRRLALLIPLFLIAVWGFGILAMSSRYTQTELFSIVDVWTRYLIGVPGAIAASIGLIFQQRELRRQGMTQFSRDALWAAIAFFWYGLIGQTFVRATTLPPSNFWNQGLFNELFGFPIQILRAVAAILAAFFIIHFLRLFEVENDKRIRQLNEARLHETERRQQEQAEMLHRVVLAQETERQRVARDLHDATGQSLTALGLGLRSVSSQLKQDPAKAETNLFQLENMVENALVELQRLISDLRPSHLDDLGLAATLRWYIGEIQKRVPMDIKLDVIGDEYQLPGEVRTAMFRITQEALTNILKHAQASVVLVELNFRSDSVYVCVDDNGQGFDTSRLGKTIRPSWGILGMRERVTLLGGEFRIFSMPGKGTRVEIEIPVINNGKEE
jgi:signal transduction histidine kinase